jgi:hypothetical protein
MWFTRSVAALAGFSLILALGLPQAAATTPGQCKVVSQDEVVSKGELMKEALGLIGTGALLILSIRKGAPPHRPRRGRGACTQGRRGNRTAFVACRPVATVALLFWIE